MELAANSWLRPGTDTLYLGSIPFFQVIRQFPFFTLAVPRFVIPPDLALCLGGSPEGLWQLNSFHPFLLHGPWLLAPLLGQNIHPKRIDGSVGMRHFRRPHPLFIFSP